MNQETEAPKTNGTLTKKQIRKEISEKLTGALAEYKQELGEKKLANRVKEVSKLISRDLRKSKKHAAHVGKAAQAKKTSLKKNSGKSVKK